MVLEGEISSRRTGKFLRFISAVTGFLFLRAVVLFILTCILGLRRRGKIEAEGSLLKMEIESSFLGFKLKKSNVDIPMRSITYVQRDEGSGTLPVLGAALGMMVGFAAGFIFLVQWSTTLLGIYIILGFACIIAGIVVDFLVSAAVPRLRGKRSILLAVGQVVYRVSGAPRDQVAQFMDLWKDKIRS